VNSPKPAPSRSRLTVADEQNHGNMSRDREGAEAEPSFHTDSSVNGLLIAESLCGASFGFRSLFFAILRRRDGFERMEKPSGNAGDFIHRILEQLFVGLGWFCKSTDLPDELERSGTNFFIRNGWIEIEKGFDISTHSL
jgi:hypothetical protein